MVDRVDDRVYPQNDMLPVDKIVHKGQRIVGRIRCMTEVQSYITFTDRNGNKKGLYLTDRDVDFIRFAAKWWTVSADHYIRKTVSKDEWLPYYTTNPDEGWRYPRYLAIARRMNKFAKLDQYAPLYAAHVERGSTAYWCTTWGGELIGAPWTKYPSGNITRTAHAWAACDLGMELERLGYTIYSEREFANGHTVQSEVVMGGKFLNPIENSQAPNKDHGMRPDLAIAGSDDRFIFIEVERESGQSPAKYRNKLMNYYTHDRVAAVWYMTDKPDTFRRITRVHEELKDQSRDMPVRVIRMDSGLYNYVYTTKFKHPSCVEDLKLIGATEGELTNG